jgi:hypothetical protein
VVKYTAIESGFALACSSSDLLELHWRENGIVADFIDPENDDRLWRVVFDDVDFIRVLDELYLSTEEDSPHKEGLVPQNLPTWWKEVSSIDLSQARFQSFSQRRVTIGSSRDGPVWTLSPRKSRSSTLRGDTRTVGDKA